MQDISLTYDFMKRLNAANIHKGQALLAAYHNVLDELDRVSKRTTKRGKEAVKRLFKIEQEMRSFR